MRKSIVVAYLLLLSLSAIGQPQPEKFCGKKIVGYVPNWEPNYTIDYSNLTHAGFAFLRPNLNGSLVEYTMQEEMALNTFLKQTKKYGCKRLISLGGGEGNDLFAAMAANDEARQIFISNVIQFCIDKKFDGIDMDWEAMDNEEKKKNYTKTLKEFRIAADKEGLLLVSTIGFGNYWCQWIENEAVLQADWIQVMVYDATGTWDASPFGNHSSFEHFQQAEEYWTKRGIAKDKLVMGLPFYGYKFNSTNGGTGKGMKYSEILMAYPEIIATEDQTPGNDYCFFNGPETIKRKSTYALENGFAGVMVWEMTQDVQGEKSLHKAIVDAFTAYCQKK